MNRQITRIAVVGVGLIAALIAGTTYWQTWASAGLADRQDNAIQRVAQFTIKRGLIYGSDGHTLIAANVRKKVADKTLYFRRYPSGALVSDVVGYSTQARSRAGLEDSLNDYLTGANANLGTVFHTELDKLRGVTVKGNNVITTLSVSAQRIANGALNGKCGAVVALDPRDGSVLVMATSPRYDPNLIEQNYGSIAKAPNACKGSSSALLNRATQGLFTPGSTFKIVTTAAALESGQFTPETSFKDPGYCEEYGKKVFNSGNPDQNGPETFGSLSLQTGFEHSVNSVFCNIGKKLGAGAILRMSKRFGLYATPPLETPQNERAPSGLFNPTNLYYPKNPETKVDPGRLAFGQERMLMTPLQNAMIAATIANRGIVMRPHLVKRIVSPSGSTVTRPGPAQLGRAVSAKNADAINTMMQLAVSGGTGKAAQIPGVKVAGKTGTAETGVSHVNTTWFVAFAPADAPRVAIAVALEDQRGFGGTTAAPIAKQVMQALLGSTPNS